MSTDLFSDLERLGALLERMSDPIAVDQIVGRERDLDFSPDDAVGVVVGIRRKSRVSARGWRSAVVLATAAAVLGGLWLATSRPGAITDVGGASNTDARASTTAVVVPDGANGHLTLDTLPAGWGPYGVATDSAYPARSDIVQRVYATQGPTPETQPAILVTSMAKDAGEPAVLNPAESITIQGSPGHLFASAGGGQSLAFGPVNGFNYSLVGYHIGRDELIAAANGVDQSPDHYGAIIDATALPTGVSERGAGFVSEVFFISRQAAEHPIPEAHWSNGSGNLWYRSFDDPNQPPLGRFGFDSVTDTTINGHPGYLATITHGNVFALTWTDGKRTFFLATSNGLTAKQLQTLAASLRPATDAEWEAMKRTQATVQPVDSTTTAVPVTTAQASGDAVTLGAANTQSVEEALAPLGYVLTNDPSTSSTPGATTYTAADQARTRTIEMTITPGTPLVPENHDRTPLAVIEQTDVLLHAQINSNSGMRFDITLTRTATAEPLPTIEAIQEMLYQLDP